MITITGQTPSHKNSRDFAINRATGNPFLKNNQRFLDWVQGAEIEVLNQAKHRYKGAVEIEMWFYVKDRTRRDLDNMEASVLDVLSAPRRNKKYGVGVIADDDIFTVRGKHAYFGGIDRANPRVEVEICDLKVPEGK